MPSSIFTFFRGRLWERIISMSAPVSPRALTPFACNCATMFLFTSPPYTMVTTESISASVILRPPTMRLSMPSCAATFVARLPPPCTSIFLPSIEAKLSSSWASCSESSTIAPPTFITVAFSIFLSLYYSIVFSSLRIEVSSSTVLALSIFMRVGLKSGIPLKIGDAARCLRVCKMAFSSSPI